MSQKERNMAGYICALLISLAAMAAGVFCVFYPLYHKWVCTQPATAAVVDFYVERKDHRQHSYPIFQYKAEGKTVRIRHNVSPTPYKIGIRWRSCTTRWIRSSIISLIPPEEIGSLFWAACFSSTWGRFLQCRSYKLGCCRFWRGNDRISIFLHRFYKKNSNVFAVGRALSQGLPAAFCFWF